MKFLSKLLTMIGISCYTLTLLQANTQQDICQFKKVIKNGWSDYNQTLNRKIISLRKSEIPRIVSSLKQPLKSDQNKSNMPPFPKILINRDDYIKLFAYSKYLEAKKKTDDVIKLYVNAYQGVSTIKMSSFIPFVYFIALNGDINKSLNSSLKHHAFTEKEKKILHQKLSSVFILDNTKLIETITAERDIVQYYINTAKIDGDYIIDKQHLQIFKKQWEIHENKYYTALMTAIKYGTVEKYIQEKKTKRKSMSIATHLKMKLLKLKLRFYKILSINIDKQDYIALSNYRINKDLFMNTNAIDYTMRDYFKLIENNKKLLEKLK